MSTLPKVAVLGLGAMGHAFASNLLKNGFTVAGWNRSPARGEDLQAHGLSLHATPQQAVADAEVIISMLADGEATHHAIVIDNGMINTRMHVVKTRGFRGVVNTNAFPGAYYLPGDFMLFADTMPFT